MINLLVHDIMCLYPEDDQINGFIFVKFVHFRNISFFCCRGAFLFLKPSLSDVSNIYTLPFSRAVWVTYLVTMIVFSCTLHITQRTESGIYDSEGTRPLSMSDSVLTAVGIACQEGLSCLEIQFFFTQNFMNSFQINLRIEHIQVTLPFTCIYASSVKFLLFFRITHQNGRNKHFLVGNYGY
jgi:hypothetical protein